MPDTKAELDPLPDDYLPNPYGDEDVVQDDEAEVSK